MISVGIGSMDIAKPSNFFELTKKITKILVYLQFFKNPVFCLKSFNFEYEKS